MASKKKSADPAVEDAPVLEIDDALFSSPADPVPVVAGAAVHMKQPPFGLTQLKFGLRRLTPSL